MAVLAINMFLPPPVVSPQPRMASALMSTSVRLCATSHTRPAWRPSLDDVHRISFGKSARHRGTGSRAVPHRLNREERLQYDRAQRKGYLELFDNLGYRRERKGSPLANIWRQWCDAQARPTVLLVKSSKADQDAVVLDVSTLRSERYHVFGALDQDLSSLKSVIDRIIDTDGLWDLEEAPEDIWTPIKDAAVWRLPQLNLRYPCENRNVAKNRAKLIANFCIESIKQSGHNTLAPVASSAKNSSPNRSLTRRRIRDGSEDAFTDTP